MNRIEDNMCYQAILFLVLWLFVCIFINKVETNLDITL